MIDLVNIPGIRKLAWRVGRRLYCWARRDAPNNPATNGEYWVIEKLLGGMGGNHAVMMDIGANQGDWTAHACETLDGFGKSGLIYSFEPTASTYAYLSKRFEADDRVRLNRMALSEINGEAEFFVVGELAGTNSLHKTEGATAEKVQKQRFDDFLAATGLDKVLFVKCDTEGHDMSVLRGAEKSLLAGQIEGWQFEYNHRWISNHSMLKDVFDFIEGKPYTLGKLCRNGIEVFEKWHPELERFFEANYVLVRNGTDLEKICSRMCFDTSNVLAPVG